MQGFKQDVKIDQNWGFLTLKKRLLARWFVSKVLERFPRETIRVGRKR